MGKRRLLSTILAVCLLLQGCGADSENTDTSQPQNRTKDSVAASVSENAVSGNDLEQIVEKAEDSDETEQAEALEGYAVFLQKYEPQQQGGGGEQELRFALLFLDGDEVPELIVMEGWAHAQGASVYLFQEGEVISIGEYGQYGALCYREKDGLLFDDYDTQGNFHSWVYQIEGKQAVLLQSYDYCQVIAGEGEETPQDTYYVDGKEVTEEQYQKVSDGWSADGYQMIEYDHCRALTKTDIRKALQEELEERIQMREDVLKQNLLLAAKAQESDILLFEYDDYDGDGKYEAFMIVGKSFTYPGGWGEETSYTGTLYFAGADGSVLELDDSYGIYRMIDGKMDFGSRKYLYFYTEYIVTANDSELWTVREGKPVDESELFWGNEVVYRDEDPREDFEIWVDAYDIFCERDHFGKDDHMWTGHSYKPYFYHYDAVED